MLSRETQVGKAPLHKASGQVATDQESRPSSAVLLTTGAFPDPRRRRLRVFAVKLAGDQPSWGWEMGGKMASCCLPDHSVEGLSMLLGTAGCPTCHRFNNSNVAVVSTGLEHLG